MTSWISWLTVVLIVFVLVYAILSVYLKKPMGIYIAAAFHIVLGLLSLPSIGLYVLGLAFLEILIATICSIRTTKSLKKP